MSELEGSSQPGLTESTLHQKRGYTQEQIAVDFALPEETERTASEHEMIDAAVSILVGEEESFSEMFEFAKKYLRVLREKEDTEESQRIFLEREQALDIDLTSQLQALIFDTGEGSLLAGQREKVVGLEGEREFQVRVIRPLGYNEASSLDKSDLWSKFMGSPDMLMSRGEGITSTIYLSPQQADELLGPLDKRNEFGAQNKFEHEYRHTQRMFVSPNDRLFHVLDEACTNVGSAYWYLRGMLGILGNTTEDLRFSQAVAAYESGDEEKKKKFLRDFRENFGTEALLLLGAKSSSAHSKGDGIAELPLLPLEGLDAFPELHFLETVLSYRAQKNLEWKKILEKNLSGAEFTRAKLEAFQGFHLTRYYQGKETPGVHFVHELSNAIEFEIQKRTEAGEKGLYDDLPPLKPFILQK